MSTSRSRHLSAMAPISTKLYWVHCHTNSPNVHPKAVYNACWRQRKKVNEAERFSVSAPVCMVRLRDEVLSSPSGLMKACVERCQASAFSAMRCGCLALGRATPAGCNWGSNSLL
eukprot:6492472-Amphidinium_carterae.2